MPIAILVMFLIGITPQQEVVSPLTTPTSTLETFTTNTHEKESLDEIVERVRIENDNKVESVEEDTNPTIRQDVRFTVYYPGDETNSGLKTSVGDYIPSFGTGPYGLATKDGKVVVATATFGCANSKRDECNIQKYLPLQDDFHIFKEGQQLTLVIIDNGKEVRLPAEVRDACGACFWDEDKQRVDLLVKYTTAFRFEGWIEYEN